MHGRTACRVRRPGSARPRPRRRFRQRRVQAHSGDPARSRSARLEPPRVQRRAGTARRAAERGEGRQGAPRTGREDGKGNCGAAGKARRRTRQAGGLGVNNSSALIIARGRASGVNPPKRNECRFHGLAPPQACPYRYVEMVSDSTGIAKRMGRQGAPCARPVTGEARPGVRSRPRRAAGRRDARTLHRRRGRPPRPAGAAARSGRPWRGR